MPPLPFGTSSITYTIYDDTSFPEPVEASVTVIYDHQRGVGLKEYDLKEAMVYPNPAAGVIHLITSDNFIGKVNLTICNSPGILTKAIVTSVEDHTVTIPVDELQAGCYFGRIENSAKEAMVFRCIK